MGVKLLVLWKQGLGDSTLLLLSEACDYQRSPREMHFPSACSPRPDKPAPLLEGGTRSQPRPILPGALSLQTCVVDHVAPSTSCPLPPSPPHGSMACFLPDLRPWLCFLATILGSSLQCNDCTNGPVGNTPAGLTQLSSRSHQSVLSIDVVLAPAWCRIPGTWREQDSLCP